jgi:hypothetical protein
MVCDGCGHHQTIDQFDARNSIMTAGERYLPEGWVMLKDGTKNMLAFHSLLCAMKSMPTGEAGKTTNTQLSMFDEAGA